MSGGVKTRTAASSHLSTLVGTGKELTPSELPTTRDLLRLGIFLRETNVENRRNCCSDDLVSDIVAQLLAQWQNANAQFKFPVIIHEVTLQKQIKKIWEQGVQVSLGQGKLAEKKSFLTNWTN